MAGTPAISWAAVRVVKAARELTSGQKLVWLEIMGLDRGPDRAYMSAGNLGRRLAMGCDNIEKARRELKRAGLLGSASRPGKREASWWPMLLPECIPSSERPSDDEIFTLAALLDDNIRRLRGHAEADHSTPLASRGRPPTGVPQSASERRDSGVLQSASERGSSGVPQSAYEGGKWGASNLRTSLLPEVGTTPPSSLPSSEEGKAGVFASERDEVGASSDSDSQPAANGSRDALVKSVLPNQPPLTREQVLAERRRIDEEWREQAQTAGDRR